MIKRSKPLTFAILITALIGCGYVSTTDYLNHIESITISPVVIEDPDFTYEQSSGKLYDEIVRETLVDRFGKKWKDGNDAQLDLNIIDYDLIPIDYDANNQPIRLQMKIVVDYTFSDRVKNKQIDRKDNYLHIHEFFIVQGRGEAAETIPEAKNRIIEELCDDLYSSLAEQW